jgi:hypothetical protein
MPVLVVKTLHASPFEVGIVSAAQFLPYAVLGLVAGAYTDRWRRKLILVWGSVGQAVSLGTVPVLWGLGVLQVWPLVALLLTFGAFSVFAMAATQSSLPPLDYRLDAGPKFTLHGIAPIAAKSHEASRAQSLAVRRRLSLGLVRRKRTVEHLSRMNGVVHARQQTRHQAQATC